MRKQTKLVLAFAAVLSTLFAVSAFAKGWVQVNGQWFYENASGERVTEKIESSGNSKFYLGADGAMVTDTFVEDYDSNGYSYYFGSNGAMVTNTWVAIDPSIVSSADDNAPSAYWFYFGSNGKCYKASGTSQLQKKTIDGKKYAFDTNGKMLTGWFDDSGDKKDSDDNPFYDAIYYAGGENDGALRTGWLAYYDGTDLDSHGKDQTDYSDKDVLWFYFNTSNNKKIGYNKAESDKDTKTVNGKKYEFEGHSGIMKSKWASQDNTEYKYYSKETDGHLVKKGWIYEVPTADQDPSKHEDDEEVWFYAQSSGNVVYDQIKKINGKYYAFNTNGLMKTGLVVFTPQGKYYDVVDLDETKVNDLMIGNFFYGKDAKGYIDIYKDGQWYPIHYFGEKGDRKTGDTVVQFADDEATFHSDNNGGKRGYVSKNSKVYHNGLVCKASSDIKYGIVLNLDGKDGLQISSTGYEVTEAELQTTAYNETIVVTTSGSRALKSGKSGVKKDADGNYWLIRDGKFVKISTQEVKWASSDFNGYCFVNPEKLKNAAYLYDVSGNVNKIAYVSVPKYHFEFKSDTVSGVSLKQYDDKYDDKDDRSYYMVCNGTKEGWIPFSGTEAVYGISDANANMTIKSSRDTDVVVGPVLDDGALIDNAGRWMTSEAGVGDFNLELFGKENYAINCSVVKVID